MFRRAGVRRFVALAILAVWGAIAQGDVFAGGFESICQLFPYNDGIPAPIVSGVAFDNQPNPWVIDGRTWQMQRLDETSGAVLQTYTPTPTTTYNDSLAWSASERDFYTVGDSMYLYRIDVNSGTTTNVGQIWTQVLGFPYLAFDPTGKLWMAENPWTLSSVDTATGQMTFECSITGMGFNQQVHAMAIDNQGRFYVASSASGDNCIYGVNPQTGATSLLTEWTDPNDTSMITSMGIDPTSGRCFAIRQEFDGNSYDYYFGEITGVPEPSTLTLLLVAAIGEIVRFLSCYFFGG